MLQSIPFYVTLPNSTTEPGRICLERLRHIREQAGYSQQELADESGVSQHTISEIELGRRKPQGRTLRKLAKVLGVEVRDFFEEEPKVVKGSADIQVDAETFKVLEALASREI